MQIYFKGAIPIGKNVIVVDEQGNEYEATYPKRAKGLVKNGRARFIDENKICLACPPDKFSEDKMEDKNVSMQEEAAKITEIAEVADSAEVAEATTADRSLTAKEILDAIQKLIFYNTSYMSEAMQSLENLPMSNDDEDIVAYASNMAESIADVVRCRETTNQQALRLYEKMYDDAVYGVQDSKLKTLRAMMESAKTACNDHIRHDLLEAIAKLYTEC